MAFNIVTLVAQYLTPDLIGRIASSLGVDQTATQKAALALVPALLGGIAAKASKPDGAGQLSDLLAKQEPGLLGNLTSYIGSSQHGALVDYGTGMVGQLLGGSAVGDLAGAVSKYAGIGEPAANSLIGTLGPVVLGSLAQHQKANKLDAGGLASLLAGQKDAIAAALPAGLSTVAGGTGWLATAINAIVPPVGTGGVADAARGVADQVGGLLKGVTTAGAAVGAVDAARRLAGQVGDATGAVSQSVAAAADKVGEVATASGTVDAARTVAGQVGGLLKGVATGITGGAADATKAVGGQVADAAKGVAASAPGGTVEAARTVAARVGGVTQVAAPAVGRAAVVGSTVEGTATRVTGGVAETLRNTGGKLGRAADTVDIAPRIGKSEWLHISRWGWLIPVVLLAIGALWWLRDSMIRSREAAIAERVRIETSERLAIETRARQKADADATAAQYGKS